jgi:hypothetical protein
VGWKRWGSVPVFGKRMELWEGFLAACAVFVMPPGVQWIYPYKWGFADIASCWFWKRKAVCFPRFTSPRLFSIKLLHSSSLEDTPLSYPSSSSLLYIYLYIYSSRFHERNWARLRFFFKIKQFISY